MCGDFNIWRGHVIKVNRGQQLYTHGAGLDIHLSYLYYDALQMQIAVTALLVKLAVTAVCLRPTLMISIINHKVKKQLLLT